MPLSFLYPFFRKHILLFVNQSLVRIQVAKLLATHLLFMAEFAHLLLFMKFVIIVNYFILKSLEKLVLAILLINFSVQFNFNFNLALRK